MPRAFPCVVAPLALLTLFISCSRQPDAAATPTATIENLKVAHACAFKRSIWYAAASVEADAERLGNLASLLRAVSRSEAVHASMHERLLATQGATTDTSKATCLPLGTTRQALKMAQSLERTEFEGLYAPMVAAAVKEGWAEAAQQFRLAGTVDSEHLSLVKEAADRNGTVPLRTYRICSSCGHVVSGSETSCVVCSGTTFESI